MKKTRFSSPRYFKLSKKQNANEILEDYVEAIEEISKDKKDVKNIDLSKHFGVSNATVNKNIKSEGITKGSIQVPGDGQPIILLSDHPTIGGYPKIANVITADYDKLVQKTPGTTNKFK